MADAIDQAIALLEAERTQLDQALEALRKVRHSRDGQRPANRVARATTVHTDTPLSGGATNEEAIDTVLRLTGGGVTTREIMDKSAEFGKELNQNSIRWVLHHGVKGGKYVKKKDGGKNRYWTASDE